MILKGTLSLMIALGLPLATQAQSILPSRSVEPPVPSDPLEMVTGPIQVADTPESRQAALELLTRARRNYALRNPDQGYELKVSFTVNSGGETQYDGAWEMEEIFIPRVGVRWKAKTTGFSTTQIAVNKHFYAEGTASTLPLRLHDARAALFGPIATPRFTDHDLIRTSEATFNGVQVTCVLLSGAGNPATPTPGRRWEESEECVDPQSGLLRLHSLAPGSYQVFDYSNAPTLGNHKLPGKVTETEGGKTVMELRVERLTPSAGYDPSLFEPSAAMTSGPPGIVMAEARKISMLMPRGAIPNSGTIHPVCVFGLITPSGELIEAHSLQPSDPNSQAAVAAAKGLKLASPAPLGARPAQRFAFIIEKFVSSSQVQP